VSEPFQICASISCSGGTCTGGTACVFLDLDADSVPEPTEILVIADLTGMSAGEVDTLRAELALEQGWFPCAALASAPGDTAVSNDFVAIAVSPGGGVPAVVTEVMADPLDEDAGEYLEIAYEGPGMYPLACCSICDGDALDEVTAWPGLFTADPDAISSDWLPAGHAALVFDSEYGLETSPYDLPESSFVFTTANTTLGNGLATTDPVVLYGPYGTAWVDVASTYGTPNASDDPLGCDDDGLDGIPFDPGNGFSVERASITGPDEEYNWRCSEEGGSPGVLPQTGDSPDLEACWISVEPAHPDSGEPFAVTAAFMNIGGATPSDAEGFLFFDANADSLPQPGELISQEPLTVPPGQIDTLTTACEAGDGFWLVAGRAVCSGEADESDNCALLCFEAGDGQGPVITEVCANPEDEDCDELVEVFFPGPGVFDLAGCLLTDGDALDTLQPWDGSAGEPGDPDAMPGRYLLAGCYAAVLDPEYTSGAQPYDFPPGTAVLTPGNTTIGDGLSCTDPVLLYASEGTSSDCVLSTYGTPLASDDPLQCDDDGLDGIPFDPGQGASVHRTTPGSPDSEDGWIAGEPTPGGPPSGMQQGVDFSVASLDLEPPFGTGDDPVQVSASLENCGTDTVPQGSLAVTIYADLDLSGTPGPGETILSALPIPPQPGDTIQLSSEWNSSASSVPIVTTLACGVDTCLLNNCLIIMWNRYLDVVINEVMYSPSPGGPEWLELFNSSDDSIDLSSWVLSDSKSSTCLCPEGFSLAAGAYAVAAADSSAFREEWPDAGCPVLQPEDWPVLNDQTQPGEPWADDLRLSYGSSQDCDRVPYDDAWGGGSGVSLEKVDPLLQGFLQTSWAPCSCGGTPGARNSAYCGGGQGGRFLEFYPDPFSPDGDGSDDVLTVELNQPEQSGKATIEVYNVQGRLVRTLLDAEPCGRRVIVSWDGRAEDGGRLAIGRYIIYARIEPAGGDVREAAAVVVLARRL
jgi:hypothetical protein